jgi:DNA-binding MarR family transcriptional regulator
LNTKNNIQKKQITYNDSIEYAAEYLAKAMLEAIRKIHKEQNFTVSHEEYIILETIYTTPGIIQIDIAQKILMQRSYVGKLLNKLENLKYIERRQEIKGKRQIIYKNFLTKKGEELYKKISEFILNETCRITSESEREEALYITTRLLDIANKIKNSYNLKF